MARLPRVEFPGASYHVMARGNEGQRIFHTEADHLLFLDTLSESLMTFGGQVHAWCLMPNHYHLAVTTPRGNLSRWLGWLQTTFTVRYNRRHRRLGHLFQGRFKAELVDTDAYAQTLVGYIHLNPVRTRRLGKTFYFGGLKELAAYRWSSHPDYLGLRRNPPVPWDQTWFNFWDQPSGSARRSYRAWIVKSLGQKPEDWHLCVQRGLVAGGEEMLAKALRFLSEKRDGLSNKWKHDTGQKFSKTKLLEFLANEPDRDLVIWVRRRVLGERAVDLATAFAYGDGSGITHAIKSLEFKAATNPDLRQAMQHYRDLLRFTD